MEGWNKSKFLEDKFYEIYLHGLIALVKDNHFTTGAKPKHCLNSLNEYLLQLKDCYKPLFSETKKTTRKNYEMNILNGKR